MKFAKGGEQNFSTEVFRITKVIQRRSRLVHRAGGFNKTPKEGQFYEKELIPLRISNQTIYKMDTSLDKLVRHGIKEYLVRWSGNSQDFDSWIPASSLKNICQDGTWSVQLLRDLAEKSLAGLLRLEYTCRFHGETSPTYRPEFDLQLEIRCLQNFAFFVSRRVKPRPTLL